MPPFVWFVSVVFENVCTLFLGTWIGRVHVCLLFGVVASFACRGMCGVSKTNNIPGKHWLKTECRASFKLTRLSASCINTAWAPYTSCSAWPLFAWKCLLLLPFGLQVQCFWLRYQHILPWARDLKECQPASTQVSPCSPSSLTHTVRIAPHKGEHIIYLVVLA